MTAPALPPFYWPLGAGDEPSGTPPNAVGHDGHCHLIQRADGCIACVDPTGKLPTRYVNRSRSEFERSLKKFASVWRGWAAVPDSEVEASVADLRAALTAIDPTWASEPEAWWSVILEQMTDGLL